MMTKNQIIRFHALLDYTKAYALLLQETGLEEDLKNIYQEIEWSQVTLNNEIKKRRRGKFPFTYGG